MKLRDLLNITRDLCVLCGTDSIIVCNPDNEDTFEVYRWVDDTTKYEYYSEEDNTPLWKGSIIPENTPEELKGRNVDLDSESWYIMPEMIQSLDIHINSLRKGLNKVMGVQ